MPRSRSIDAVLSDAEQIERVWKDNSTFKLGELTLEQFQAMIADLRTQRSRTEDLRTQLTAAVNDTNTKALALTTANTRARSGFRAFYGPDSTQYEQSGGTRTSERKRPARKAKAKP